MILRVQARMRNLGSIAYEQAWRQMRAFTAGRDADTADEIWLAAHPPVYTLGISADRSHILKDTRIPVVESDRGGQVTYHGPGQVIAYLLIDLRRAGYGIRSLVTRIEDTVTAGRDADTADEIWLAAHPPVYTLGISADRSHILKDRTARIRIDSRPAGCRPAGSVRRRRQDLRARAEGKPRLHLSRGEPERLLRSGAVCRHQPLRLAGPALDEHARRRQRRQLRARRPAAAGGPWRAAFPLE